MERIKNRNDTRTITIATGTVANEVARIGGDVKYVAGELGKDIKVGASYINNSAQTMYVHSINTARDVTEQGLNTGAIITRNLNNAIENTGTKKFGLGVVGGGVGELVVESRSYSEGKKDITPTNLIGTANNILKSGLTGGITANTNTAQSLGINVFSSVALKGTNTTDSLKESSISSTISIIGGKYNIPETYSGLYNSYTTEYIKNILKNMKKIKR